MNSVLTRVSSPAEVRALSEAALPELCASLRDEIIAVCGKVGGHLGASLGTVELTVALHRVFRSPRDKIVFDVGHQAYAHKLLTGRREQMPTLRQAGGVAPFLDPRESPHDAFAAGHACTALSAASGFAEAQTLRGEDAHAVAVLGDAALTGGLTFEALNHLVQTSRPVVLVLNDNGMSISANVGAIPAMLRGPGARAFFESLGLTYLGPVDGHDLSALIPVLQESRRSRRSLVVHVRTQKGKGFSFAESDETTRGHAMGPYELRDGKLVRSRHGQRTFSEAFAAALENVMAADPRAVAITPAMIEGSALTAVKARFPDRVHDVGIAEAHAVTFAAGLAAGGARPVVCIYSTFLQRAYDSLLHDVCLQNLNVVIAIDRAGLVGADGSTHQGAYDLSFLRPLPNLTIAAPVVGEDLEPLLREAVGRSGPTALRFPRGTLPPPGAVRSVSEHGDAPNNDAPKGVASAASASGGGVKRDGARWLRRNEFARATVVGLGPLLLAALDASPDVNVLDVRYLQPLDEAKLEEAARSGRVVTLEEGTTRGGLGSAFLELCAKRGWSPRVTLLGLPDEPVRHGDARKQRAELGLDAAGIRRALEALARQA
ncbi:MAG: 1-deoxy-D-xylulose-5-phosphate synthase [Myxococcaceae bacterium]